MRDENQCLHGRDAHAPWAFASHTLSSHFRISEAVGVLLAECEVEAFGSRFREAADADGRDALCPSAKIQKQAAFDIISNPRVFEFLKNAFRLMLIQRNEAPHSHGAVCEIVSGFITEFFRCPGIQNPDTNEDAD